MSTVSSLLSAELSVPEKYIENIIALLDEGNTIPFIARYRKELHGGMDDTTLRTLCDRLEYLRNLQQRRDEVKKSIEQQEKLTEDLAAAIDKAATLAEVEDLYRPFKQKRKTRASVAREKGLEPLAEALYAQANTLPWDLEELARQYIREDAGVLTAQDALDGARDIIAENISDSADIRSKIRAYMMKNALIRSVAAIEEDSVYRMYYDFAQSVAKIPSHQILAINRGEREKFLKVSVECDEKAVCSLIRRQVVVPGSPSMQFVISAVEDAYSRLIQPSMEREIRSSLTDEANEGAIRNFAINLRPLLMQPPVRGHVTMGLDPGFRNGCKVAVIDAFGKVLDTSVVYPTFSQRHEQEAIDKLSLLIKKHHIEHIAIGNGTASRETEQMTVKLIHKLGGNLSYMIVNEAGASVYSVSKLAAQEFPEYDVNLRSAVSIARRLQDPLAELVKIDPKAIGVGQYQHDMPQKRLDDSLAGVVEDCVNSVGVDLNTASASLLQRVAGLSAALAGNIVSYREENDGFTSRNQLLKVPKLGPKAYQQCAGFLRVPESKNLLDHTGVHPESYEAVKTLLTFAGLTVKDITDGKFNVLTDYIQSAGEEAVAEKCGIGVPTLRDLVSELGKPGRDPRDELPAPLLRTDVLSISDLKTGMVLSGTVRNVIDFGVFVDIGVHQDGLVHISQITDKFIRHPSEVLSVGDVVKVSVLDVDEGKKRIALTMKNI